MNIQLQNNDKGAMFVIFQFYSTLNSKYSIYSLYSLQTSKLRKPDSIKLENKIWRHCQKSTYFFIMFGIWRKFLVGYSELCKISRMEHFGTIFNEFLRQNTTQSFVYKGFDQKPGNRKKQSCFDQYLVNESANLVLE